jgi:hypothetical protein
MSFASEKFSMTVKNITGGRAGNFLPGPALKDLPYFRSYIAILKPKNADF